VLSTRAAAVLEIHTETPFRTVQESIMTRQHRWRRAILLSLLGHMAAIALFYAVADKLGQLPSRPGSSPEAPSPAVEQEKDMWVMDVGELPTPAAVLPRVDPPPAVASAPPVKPDVAPASAGHESHDEAIHGSKDGAGHTNSGTAATPAEGSGGVTPSTPVNATTAFFQLPTQAQSVVYVFDRSGSMGMAGRLNQARQELLTSLERLPATARFQVIPYNRVAEPLRIAGHSDLVPATIENKRQTALLLEGLAPEGGTEYLTALKRALLLQPEVIYFVTDADDLHPDQVRALTLLNHGRTVIHTIELTASHRAGPGTGLQVLARENGGQYRGVDVH
jgi:hypothetical protein